MIKGVLLTLLFNLFKILLKKEGLLKLMLYI